MHAQGPSPPGPSPTQPSQKPFRALVFGAVIGSLCLLILHQIWTLEAFSALIVSRVVSESKLRHISLHDHNHEDYSQFGKVADKLEGSLWPYACWDPAGHGPSNLTIATVLGGMPDTYTKALRKNRLQYAQKHGYRYCELSGIDKNRIPAWSKLPWMLSLLPCTPYVLHLDADAMLSNLSLSFDPWMEFMAREGVDQLFSADVIPESAINYGVFMIRRADWVWRFYRRLYNMCTCAWGRTHDWPAEQGLAYDLLAADLNSSDTRRSRIIPTDGWNRIVNNGALPGPRDVVIHLVYPTRFPPGSACATQKEFTRACKYEGMTYYLTEIIGKGQAQAPDNLSDMFVSSNHTCQPVRSTSLFLAKETYSSDSDALSSSVMGFDVDLKTGDITGVWVGEVGCVGYRERTCGIPDLWDRKAGNGPWPRWNGTVI